MAATAKNVLRLRKHRIVVRALTAMTVAHFALGVALHAQNEPLTVGQAVSGTLSGGQSHTYVIHAGAGQFVRAVVQQNGIHLSVSVVDPAKKLLVWADSLNGEFGPEAVSTIAQQEEDLQLQIVSRDKQAAAGQYQVTLTDLRAPPTDEDKARMVGEFDYLEGALALETGTTESRATAITHWQASLRIWQALNDPYEEALCLTGIGVANSNSGAKQQALDAFNQALPLARAAGDSDGQAILYNNLGLVYAATGDRQKALDAYNDSLPLRRTVGDRRGEGTVLNNIGAVYSDLGNKQKALDYYSQSLPFRQAVVDRTGEAAVFNNMAEVYSDLGDKQKALENFNQALPIERAINDRAAQGVTLNNIGKVYSDLGEKQQALDYYNQALVLRRAVGDKSGEASTLNNIGVTYSFLGEKQKALDYYNQSLALLRGTSDKPGEAQELNNIGSIYAQLGNLEQAVQYYSEALPLRRDVGDRAGEAATLNNIGRLYYQVRRFPQALDSYNQALAIRRAVGDRDGEANTLASIGLADLAVGQKPEAFDSYAQALPMFQAVQDPAGESSDLISLMRYERDSNNLSLAVFFGKQAIDLLQQMRRNIQGLEKEDQLSFLESREGYYRELAGLLIAEGRLPEAQQVLDMLKLEEYSEYTEHRGDAGSPEQPVAYADAEQKAKQQGDQIEAEITALGQQWAALDAKRATLSADEKKTYDDLSAKLEDANGQMRQYLAGLSDDFSTAQKSLAETTAANERLRNYKGETNDLQGMLGKLEPGTVAIYTVVLPDRLSMIVITPQTMFAHDVSISAIALRSKIAAFTGLFSSGSAPSDDAVKEKSQALYQVLFEPDIQTALDGAGAKTLLWSLDDVLRYVPIAALYDGKQYLVERYQNVELTPNRSSLLEEPQMTKVTGVAMGVSKVYDAKDNLGPLDSVPGELDAVVHNDAVAGSHGPIAGSIMLNDSFTEKSLVDALGTQPRVVHIASHYVYEAGSDENSFLLLGGKDTGGQGFHLTLAEMEDNKQINFEGVELLTLSGCQTALGANDADGHEVDGLGLVATEEKHAKAVMATLWKVDDSSAGSLMAAFYKLWIGPPGMNKAEALRQAQLSLLHGRGAAAASSGGGAGASTTTGADTTNPYYWAPFILIGNWK
jgi:CHAT domain-containing protein/Tfp pilus assembly protein PilF